MVLANTKHLIGLDIGSSAVKAVRLQSKAGRYLIKALAFVPLPVVWEEGTDRSELVLSAVRECLEKLQARRWDVVCGLNGEHVILRPFRFAPLPKAEVLGAVRLEAMQVCPFGLEQASVDYQLLRWDRTGQDATEADSGLQPLTGILTVARQEAIGSQRHLVARAGGRCVLMDVDGLALLNAVYALRPGQEPDEPITDPVAVLHVGHTTTTLAIGAPGVAPFVRDIPYAGQAVMAGIADHLEIKPQEVLQHLRTEGVLPDEGLVALHQACQEMAEHVRETLRYHAAQQAGPGPASVWLSGGFASVPGFAEQLDRALNRVTIRVWDPLKQLGGPIEGQTAPGPAFAVAVGLAMRVL